MKKLLLVGTCLVLIVAMLTGCFEGTKEFTCQDLTISVPSNMKDVSGESEYSRFTFTLLSGKMGAAGIRESFADLGNNAAAMTTMDYANAVIKANNYTSMAVTRTEKDYVYFTYEATSEGINFKYVAGCFKGEDAFWLVQLYTPAEDFNLNELVLILDTVKLG